MDKPKMDKPKMDKPKMDKPKMDKFIKIYTNILISNMVF